MERKPNLTGETTAAAQLHAGLITYLAERGVEGWPAREDEDEYSPAVGRNVQARVFGPRGWNLVNVQQIVDEHDINAFKGQIDEDSDELVGVDFEGADSFMISPQKVAKRAGNNASMLYTVEDFEIEMLIEDLRGLSNE